MVSYSSSARPVGATAYEANEGIRNQRVLVPSLPQQWTLKPMGNEGQTDSFRDDSLCVCCGAYYHVIVI